MKVDIPLSIEDLNHINIEDYDVFYFWIIATGEDSKG